MATEDQGLTRRGLLTGVLGAAAAAAIGGTRMSAAADKVRIVRVESSQIWNGDKRDPQVVGRMVDRGVQAFTGESTRERAWARFFKPGDRVGLKINLLGRPFVYTAREITEAVAAGAMAAGVKGENLIVWDRHRDHFEPTVYQFGRGKFGETIKSGGQYDSSKALQASGGLAPIDTIAVHDTDVTVNLPIIKDHSGSGVTLALKNIAFGCYNHHRSAHNGNCDPYIAEACQHYYSVTKVPLIVLDATEGCYEGGPDPRDRSRLWRENAIYVATDPVALDVVCRKILLDKRAENGLPDKFRQCRHIETAAEKGLGVLDPARIEVVTVRI
jgi:hypothetical protein